MTPAEMAAVSAPVYLLLGDKDLLFPCQYCLLLGVGERERAVQHAVAGPQPPMTRTNLVAPSPLLEWNASD